MSGHIGEPETPEEKAIRENMISELLDLGDYTEAMEVEDAAMGRLPR